MLLMVIPMCASACEKMITTLFPWLCDNDSACWQGCRCRNIQGLLVVDNNAVGVASIGELVIITPVLAIVGEHTLLAVLVIPNLAQLTVLHNSASVREKCSVAEAFTPISLIGAVGCCTGGYAISVHP